MSYDSSCSGDSFIDAIEEENAWCLSYGNNGVDRPVYVYFFESTPCPYEMSGAPCKFSFCAGFSSYDLEDLHNSH